MHASPYLVFVPTPGLTGGHQMCGKSRSGEGFPWRFPLGACRALWIIIRLDFTLLWFKSYCRFSFRTGWTLLRKLKSRFEVSSLGCLDVLRWRCLRGGVVWTGDPRSDAHGKKSGGSKAYWELKFGLTLHSGSKRARFSHHNSEIKMTLTGDLFLACPQMWNAI